MHTLFINETTEIFLVIPDLIFFFPPSVSIVFIHHVTNLFKL